MHNHMYYFCYWLVVLLALFSEQSVASTADGTLDPYVKPLLLRTITFGEAREYTAPPCGKKRSDFEGKQRSVKQSSTDKVKNLFENGVLLTEEDKQEVMADYSYYITDSSRPKVNEILNGNLQGLSTTALSILSWTVGVDYNTLLAIRDTPEAVAHYKDVHSSRGKRAAATNHQTDDTYVNGFYGNADGTTASYSSASERSEEPLGLYFTPNSAKRLSSINFNGDDQNDGGIEVYIKQDEASSFGFKAEGGLKAAWGFQVSTDQSISLDIKVYSDLGCSTRIASSQFSIDLTKDTYSANDGAKGSIEFKGVAHCVTVTHQGAGTLTLQMDNLVYGSPYSGRILFDEPPLNKDHTLSADGSAITDYYGEGTVFTGTYSADRLGVYLHLGQNSSFSTHPHGHIMIHKAYAEASLRVQIYRGVKHFFRIFISPNTTDAGTLSDITFSLFSGPFCGKSEGSQTYSFPKGATVGGTYKASVLLPFGTVITCVNIDYVEQTGNATISALIFDTDLAVPKAPAAGAQGYYILNKAAYDKGQYAAYTAAYRSTATLAEPSTNSPTGMIYKTNWFTRKGYVTISNPDRSLCLDVWKSNIVAGTSIGTFSCMAQDNQKFVVEKPDATGGIWTAWHPFGHPGLCMDTAGGATEAGTGIRLAQCNNATSQRWYRAPRTSLPPFQSAPTTSAPTTSAPTTSAPTTQAPAP